MKQENFNLHLTEENARLKMQVLLLIDAVNALDEAMSGVFELMVDQGWLAENSVGLRDYQRKLAQARKEGLPVGRSRNVKTVTCPSCQTVVKLTGQGQEGCTFCGHQF